MRSFPYEIDYVLHEFSEQPDIIDQNQFAFIDLERKDNLQN